jgi:two-component system, OmpR family, response regulator MtrA
MVNRPGVLVADPDPGIRRLLRRHFGGVGYSVTTADVGRTLLDQVQRTVPDVVIISADLSDPGGVELVKRVRLATTAPIIVLRPASSRLTPGEILDAGANDCLEQPFLLEELAARTRRLLHRAGVWLGPRVFLTDFGRIEINALERTADLNGEQIALTRKEFDLLVVLAGANGGTLSHEDLQRRVWGESDIGGRQNLRRIIHGLRAKIEPHPGDPVFLIGVRGAGYQLNMRLEPPSDR